MECPFCGSNKTNEFDYYTDEFGKDIKEYYCTNCFEEFEIEELPIEWLKISTSRFQFDESKAIEMAKRFI